MKRWGNPLIAAIFSAALICGCAGNDPDKLTSEAISQRNQTVCDSISDYRMRYNCSLQVAVSKDDAALCRNIESQEWADECYTVMAAKRRDITVCDSIGRQVNREGCYKRFAAH